MTVTESNTWEGRPITVTWDESLALPPRESTTQSSGVCFTESGQIVLVNGGGDSWSLPGGHPETGETTEEALVREVMEEACAAVEAYAYLGSQRVDDPAEPEAYFQTRWWARVRLLPFEPRHEMTERRLVLPGQFVAALGWNTTEIANAILEAALIAERKARR